MFSPFKTRVIATDRGFTLIEAMVALAIVGITFVVILDLRNHDIERTFHSARVTTAALLGQERLTAFELSRPTEIGEWTGTFPSNQEFAWKAQVTSTPWDFVRQITLFVFWHEGDRQEQVEFSTYVFDAP
jgi:prepilin-type N-terminal cleavage/methylation domain-containing protein